MRLPRRISLHPSRRLAGLLIAAHLAAVFAVVMLDAHALVRAGAGTLVILSLAASMWRYAWLRAASAVVALELHSDERITVTYRCGAWREARVGATTTVLPGLIVIQLQPVGSRRSEAVVILDASADGEQLRALRSWLRWRSQPRKERGPAGPANQA